jgi:soluble lytic murein transglycosylase-like protein
MQNSIVPIAPHYTVSILRRRALITFAALLGMVALVLARQTHATAPTLAEGQTASQAASQPSPAAGQASETAGNPSSAPVQLTSGNPVIDGVVMASAARYGVDPRLVFAVMKKESRFNPRARSRKNAMGLMQIVPATAQRFHKSNPSDMGQNVDCGVHYLRWLLEKFSGDVRLALAGYNAGENTVIHCGYRVPNISETRNYVDTIIANYGQTHHPMLDPDQAREVFSPEKTGTASSS